MAPRISRVITFIYVGFCSFANIGSTGSLALTLPPPATNNFTINTFKQRAKENYMDKTIIFICEFWHKTAFYKSDLT
jgi:hypothetical protein